MAVTKTDEFNDWVRHEGKEFLYELTCVCRLYTEFYESVEICRGESAYCYATMGYIAVSVSDDDAMILWVTSLT